MASRIELRRWRQLSFGCFASAALFAWFAFTDGVPMANELMQVEGTISTARWTGSAKSPAYQLQLVDDRRLYVVDTDMIWDRLGAPDSIDWIGKRVKFVTAKRPTRLHSKTIVYTLDLEDRPIYSIIDIERRRNAERPKLALLILAFVIAGIWCFRKQKRLAFKVQNES